MEKGTAHPQTVSNQRSPTLKKFLSRYFRYLPLEFPNIIPRIHQTEPDKTRKSNLCVLLILHNQSVIEEPFNIVSTGQNHLHGCPISSWRHLPGLTKFWMNHLWMPQNRSGANSATIIRIGRLGRRIILAFTHKCASPQTVFSVNNLSDLLAETS